MSIANKIGPSVCAFSIFNLSSLRCDSFEVYAGPGAAYTIAESFSDSVNITMTTLQSHCAVTSSPHLLGFRFYAQGLAAGLRLRIFDIRGNLIESLEATSAATFTGHSVVLHWSANSTRVGGIAGFNQTTIVEQSAHPDLVFVEGRLTPRYLMSGDYEFAISAPLTFTVLPSSLLIQHCPTDFNFTFESGGVTLWGPSVFNITQRGLLTISAIDIEAASVCYFSVFQYSRQVNRCVTFDAFSGSETSFVVAAATVHGLRRNITMVSNQSVCIVFSSAHTLNYSFWSNGIESYDDLTVFSSALESLNLFTSPNNFSTARKTVMMRWYTDISVNTGAAGLHPTAIVAPNAHPDLRYRNEFIEGTFRSMVRQSYFDASEDPTLPPSFEPWIDPPEDDEDLGLSAVGISIIVGGFVLTAIVLAVIIVVYLKRNSEVAPEQPRPNLEPPYRPEDGPPNVSPIGMHHQEAPPNYAPEPFDEISSDCPNPYKVDT
jgi:hypothetical protein